MHAKFNKWELESPEGSWFQLKPAGAPSEGGADWWSASIQAGSIILCVATAHVHMTSNQLECLMMGMACPKRGQLTTGMLCLPFLLA